MSLASSASKGGQFVTPAGFGVAVKNPFNFQSNQLEKIYSSLHAAPLAVTFSNLTYAVDLPSNAILTQFNIAVATAFNGTAPTIEVSSFDPNLTAPATPTASPVGTTGAATFSYKVVALAPDTLVSNMAVLSQYGWSLGSAAGTSTTSNATLSSSNYNAVAWTAYSAAVKYAVYRTAAPAGYGLGLLGFTVAPNFNDYGNAPLPVNFLFQPQGQLLAVPNTLQPVAAGDLLPASADLGSTGGLVVIPANLSNQSPFFSQAGFPTAVQRMYVTLAIGGSTAGAATLLTQFHIPSSQGSSPTYSE